MRLHLRGTCRHELHAFSGPRAPPAELLRDAALIRALGANFVRAGHYMQDRRWLALLDAGGLALWTESLSWGASLANVTSADYVDAQLLAMRALYEVAHNHPASAQARYARKKERKKGRNETRPKKRKDR